MKGLLPLPKESGCGSWRARSLVTVTIPGMSRQFSSSAWDCLRDNWSRLFMPRQQSSAAIRANHSHQLRTGRVLSLRILEASAGLRSPEALDRSYGLPSPHLPSITEGWLFDAPSTASTTKAHPGNRCFLMHFSLYNCSNLLMSHPTLSHCTVPGPRAKDFSMFPCVRLLDGNTSSMFQKTECSLHLSAPPLCTSALHCELRAWDVPCQTCSQCHHAKRACP